MRLSGIVLWFVASACGSVKGSDVDAALDDAPATDAPPATHYHYVVDRINVPTNTQEVMQYGLDLNGDSTIDNRIGGLIIQFRTTANDPAVSTQASVDRGTTITLIDFATTDFTTATGATVAQFAGLQPSPVPCVNAGDTVCRGHLMGTGSFTAATMPVNPPLVGDVVNGRFLGGPGEAEINFILPAGGITRLHLIGAHVLITTADETRATLILAGAVTEAERDSKIFPALRAEALAQIAASCTTTTPPTCGCPATSSAANWLTSFDGADGTTKNCTISAAEVMAASFTFAPDVMIGGVPAISLGFGATAVKGTFNPP